MAATPHDPPETAPGLHVSRRRLLKACVYATGTALTGGLSTFRLGPAGAQAITQKRIYIAADDHTDYMWIADEDTYRQAFLSMVDYNLGLTTNTLGNAAPYQNRWNCDGSFWMWTYEKNNTLADFEGKFIARLQSGHLSSPLNTLVGVYGGTPLEGVLRGLYYAGRIERRYGLRFPLAVAMENQTLPYGLGSVWAGAGAKYSWRGVCNCATLVPRAYDREHEIYWYTGPDGSRVLMKWHSLYAKLTPNPNYSQYYQNLGEPYGASFQDANENVGGYAEARYTFEAVDFVDGDPTFTSKYPYKIIGVFGQGWDSIQTLNNVFVQAAQIQTNASRQVIVSNEADFFADFAASYGANLPTQSVTFGNEWELGAVNMTELYASVRRSIEKMRSAEALATLVSLQNPSFLDSRTPTYPALTAGAGSLPPGVPLSARDVRDLAFVNLGLMWEHDFPYGGPGVTDAQRVAFNQRTAANVNAYVDGLFADSRAALGGQIASTGTNPRFFAFNPLGWTRTDYADFAYSGTGPVHVVDVTTGQEAPSQLVTIDGSPYLRVLAAGVPSLGYKTLEVRSGAGASFPPAATVTGRVLDNAAYTITVADDGAITSLIDKARGGRELAGQMGQNGRTRPVRLNDLGYNAGTNYTSTAAVENAGPVSVTLAVSVSGGDVPLDHVSRVTLFHSALDTPRVELRNDVNEVFQTVSTWGFGFNVTAPDVHMEEVGAILHARLSTDGGHYSPRNARYDWTSLNHFADMGGADGYGATLSNADCHFVKIGDSTPNTANSNVPPGQDVSINADGVLDTQTPILFPAAGGPLFGHVTDQAGATHFLQRFALLPRPAFDPVQAMRFALGHQNPLVTGAITSGTGSRPYPATTYSLLSVSDPNVLVWAVKPAEEGIGQGIVTRVWNLSANAVPFTLAVTPTLTSATQATHIETDLAAAKVSGGRLSATAGAQQIQTYRLHVPVPRPPAAPTALVATAGDGQVGLTWNGGSGATAYNVYRSTASGGGYVKINTSPLPSRSYLDGKAADGTTYYYVVTGLSAGGESLFSNQATAQPAAATLILAINCGGKAVPPFAADADATGGSALTTTAAIATVGVLNPAPAAVYQSGRSGAFSYALPGLTPGANYTVRLHFAEIVEAAANRRLFSVTLNGASVLTSYDAFAVGGGKNKASVRAFPAVADGTGTITLGFAPTAASPDQNAFVCGLQVLQAAKPPQTLLTTQTPTLPNQTDGVPYELGVKFTASAPGQVTALRYWRSTSEAGSHTGRLWKSDGTLLATVSFTGETASGWQQQPLTAPVPLTVGQVYVATVSTNGYFDVTYDAFASPVTNGGSLSTVADGHNGVYGKPGVFPTGDYRNSNYFRDVVFVPS